MVRLPKSTKTKTNQFTKQKSTILNATTSVDNVTDLTKILPNIIPDSLTSLSMSIANGILTSKNTDTTSILDVPTHKSNAPNKSTFSSKYLHYKKFLHNKDATIDYHHNYVELITITASLSIIWEHFNELIMWLHNFTKVLNGIVALNNTVVSTYWNTNPLLRQISKLID